MDPADFAAVRASSGARVARKSHGPPFLESAMANQINCAFCGTSADIRPRTGDALTFTCLRCGNYTIVGTAQSLLRERPIQNPGAVSGWIRRQNLMGVTPNISSADVPRLRALTKPAFRERVERYLVGVADKTQRLDEWFKPGQEEFIGISHSDHVNELVVILEYLRQEELMTSTLKGDERLTPKGFICRHVVRWYYSCNLPQQNGSVGFRR
jgi:hypothetical protein